MISGALAHLQRVEDAVVAMERRGFCADARYCDQQAGVARTQERRLLDELGSELAHRGINGTDEIWSSPKQMVALFHQPGGLGLPPSPVWKKGPVLPGFTKLDQTALEWIRGQSPSHKTLIDAIIELRRTRGAIKYLSKLPLFVAPDGRVHPICGPGDDSGENPGAVTGRLAMKKPEGQQLPRDAEKDPFKVRGAIVAPPGMALVVCDYSALEVVLLADICVRLFNDWQTAEMVAPGAPDIHSVTCKEVFGVRLGHVMKDGRRMADLALDEFKTVKEAADKRTIAKNTRYGVYYGQGPHGLAGRLGISKDEAQEILDALYAFQPALKRYQDWVRAYIKEHGGISSYLGRWCPLEVLIAEGTTKSLGRAWRRALNFPMQAGGADVVGLAMVLVESDRRLKEIGYGVVLQIHDELVLEGPEKAADEALAIVKRRMVEAGERLRLRVPLQVSGTAAKRYIDAK